MEINLSHCAPNTVMTGKMADLRRQLGETWESYQPEPQCPNCNDFKENGFLCTNFEFHGKPSRNQLRVMRNRLTRVRRDKAGLRKVRN